jgi:hypothetical protein
VKHDFNAGAGRYNGENFADFLKRAKALAALATF